jgi:putative MATE family efflux protein
MDTHTPPPARSRPRGGALTEGPVGRTLWRATLPLALALVVMFGVQLAEAWLVGRIGATALAALGFAAPVVLTAMSFGIGLSAGASAVVGRAIGAGEAGIGRLSRHVLAISAALGLVTGAVGFVLAPELPGWMGAGGEAAELATDYLRVWFPAAVLLMAGMAALALLRAAGDTGFQGAALAGAGVISLLLGWPLAFGIGSWPGFGLVGFPAAAALSWAGMLAASLWRIRGLGLLDGEGQSSLAAAARRVGRVGVPAAATNAIIPLAAGVFTALVAQHGEAAVAGFALGGRAEAMCMVAFFALSAVANPFAAQNAGAGRPDRVQEGMRLSLLFCGGLGLALAAALALGAPFVAAHLARDAAVAESAELYLRIMPWGFGAVGAIAVANAAFNGLERPMAAVAISMARTFVLGVPAAWLGGELAGEAGTLAGILAANVIAGALAAGWILRAANADHHGRP